MSASIARPLTESLHHEVVCRERDIERYLPSPPGHPLGFDQAVALALQRIREAQVATRRSSATMPGAPSDPLPTDPQWAGGSLYIDVRELDTDVAPDALWQVIEGIGGENGWYSFPLAWAMRGWLDRLVGGVGLRRGRRDAHRLRAAEMRLPGMAWLEMRVDGDAGGPARYRQRALFHPHGLLGHLYWWGISPFHAVVFGGMARNIVRAAARSQEQPANPSGASTAGGPAAFGPGIAPGPGRASGSVAPPEDGSARTGRSEPPERS